MLNITIPTLLIKALSLYSNVMSHKKTTIHPKANAQASVTLHCVQAYTNGGKLIRREVKVWYGEGTSMSQGCMVYTDWSVFKDLNDLTEAVYPC